MSERTARYHYLWVAYMASLAVLWEYQVWSDGERRRTMLGFHIYGSVDTKNVRRIPHRLIAAADPLDYHRWQLVYRGWDNIWGRQMYELEHLAPGQQPTPVPTGAIGQFDFSNFPTPTARMVLEAWHPNADDEDPDPPDPSPGEPLRLSPRSSDESPDEFYGRVARIYRAFAATGRPTSDIAELAGVSKQTAARWVHEARNRGHLEQTTRGKVNR